MGTIRVHDGNYGSHLDINYSFYKDVSKRTWTMYADLVLTCGSMNMGPWGAIGSNQIGDSTNSNGLNKKVSLGTSYTIISTSKTGSYNATGDAPSVKLPWRFGVKSSWGGYVTPSGTATAYGESIGSATRTNTISHWTWGYKHQEGNNGDKNAFLVATTNFTANVGDSYTMDSGKAINIPNGFYLDNTFGSGYTGTWKTYPMGSTVVQPNSGASFEYDYRPIDYSISYNLPKGISSNNPSTYNVLYGVTFKNPGNRVGYTFKNWTINNSVVSGINPGQNASFSDKDDFFNKIKDRTIGNKTVVANWTQNTYTITYNANGGEDAPSAQNYSYIDNAVVGLSNMEPNRTGYDFLGWSTNSAATEPDYTTGDWYPRQPYNTTLYAVWRYSKPYNVKGNVVSTGPFSITVSYSASAAVGSGLGYDILYRLPGETSWNPYSAGHGPSGTTEVKGLQPETTYELVVRATNVTGSTDSALMTAKTIADQASVRIKKEGSWKKGKVYIKKDGHWLKAKKVYIKKDGHWVINKNN